MVVGGRVLEAKGVSLRTLAALSLRCVFGVSSVTQPSVSAGAQ